MLRLISISVRRCKQMRIHHVAIMPILSRNNPFRKAGTLHTHFRTSATADQDRHVIAAEHRLYLYKITDDTINGLHVEGQTAVDLTLAVKLVQSLLQHIGVYTSPILHTEQQRVQ